jgi:L-alanine-DL-glutamate epimerase-like enolase superfamily enzyme
VNLALGVHLGVSQPNAAWQEVVRAYYHTWYNDVVTGLPELKDGYLYPLTGPGLGLSLDPSVRKRPDATVQVSS